jgi:acyl transferase domain-containing protein
MAESSGADTLGKIGMAGRYPDAWSPAQCITFFKDDELPQSGVSRELVSHPDYVKARGIYPSAFLFDASSFGDTPREAELMDPQQRVFWNARGRIYE